MWHGTGQTDPKRTYADRQGVFMMQFCTKGMWGRGLYFDEKASYSHSYAHCCPGSSHRQFMLTTLFSGDEIRVMPNNPGIQMCPQARKRYDTVTGETAGSKVYIVYENGRTYPEYLVTYG